MNDNMQMPGGATATFPYLSFNGNCREAMSFYNECFGGQLDLMTVKDSKMADQMPAEMQDKIMHSKLESGAIKFMASDMMMPGSLSQGNNISMLLNSTSDAETKMYFDKLAAGGKVASPLKTESWGDTFGDLTDKFGIRWMFNATKPK